MFSPDNPDNIAHITDSPDNINLEERCVWCKTYAMKYGFACFLLNSVVVISIGLILLLTQVIIPLIGSIPTRVANEPMFGCLPNMTISNYSYGCVFTGLVITLIITVTIIVTIPIIGCIIDCKRSFKPADEVNLIKTRVFGDAGVANYNTL